MAKKFVRVKDKRTGHEYSTARVDTRHHEVLDKPATDRVGRPLPAKTSVAALKKSEDNDDTKAAATGAPSTKETKK